MGTMEKEDIGNNCKKFTLLIQKPRQFLPILCVYIYEGREVAVEVVDEEEDSYHCAVPFC